MEVGGDDEFSSKKLKLSWSCCIGCRSRGMKMFALLLVKVMRLVIVVVNEQ